MDEGTDGSRNRNHPQDNREAAGRFAAVAERGCNGDLSSAGLLPGGDEAGSASRKQYGAAGRSTGCNKSKKLDLKSNKEGCLICSNLPLSVIVKI